MNITTPRILAIDDTPANLLTLGSALSDEFDLQMANSGPEGLRLAAASPPDLILLDIMMPGMDGYDVCRQLKNDPELSRIPVIFVTALDDFSSESYGLSLGAADYITKPINIIIARQRIRNLLEAEHLRHEVEAQRNQLADQVEMLEKLTVAIEQSPASVIITDKNTAIQYVNPQFTKITGYDKEEVIGQNPRILRSGETNRAVYETLWETLKTGLSWQGELLNKRKNGEVYWEEAHIAPVKNKMGETTHYVAVKTDISERKATEAHLKLSASVFTHTREGIMITDVRGTIIDVNEAFSRITGYARDEAIGETPRLLKSGRQAPEHYAAMWNDLAKHGYWYGEVWNRRKNGEVYAEILTISAVHDSAGEPQHFVALFSDITALKTHEQQLEHLAHYDALTDLPSRMLLADRLQQAILNSQRRANSLAVVFIDLDGFKAVNDKHGHAMGDELLIILSQRMKAALREGDTLARIGGDEFVAVLIDLEQADDHEQVLSRLLQAVADPLTIENTSLQVSASIGATIYPQDNTNAQNLIDHADQAMYLAKAAGKNCYRLFGAD